MTIKGKPARHWHGDVFQRYLEATQRAAGARGAALLVEAAGLAHGDPLLVHSGAGYAIPELEDAAAALSTLDALHGHQGRQRVSAIRFYPSQVATACLLCISAGKVALRDKTADSLAGASVERRNGAGSRSTREPAPRIWVGLSFDSTAAVDALECLGREALEVPVNNVEWLAHTLLVGASLVWETHQLTCMMRDPVSQLPTRPEFQARLKTAFREATDRDQSLGVLLINPDGFGAVNQRVGRENGDRAVAEVAQILGGSLRQSDTVYRYGGAVFAVLMPKAEQQAVHTVAKKLRQALTGAYLEGAVRLAFSVGAVVYQNSQEASRPVDELDLLRRADHALNLAKRAGGACTVLWKPEDPELAGVGLDRLSGIFTADTEKDYRNMLLLWDTIAVISSGAQKEQIAGEFVDRIRLSLNPSRVALFEYPTDAVCRQVAAVQHASDERRQAVELSKDQQALMDRVHSERHTGQLNFERGEPGAGSTTVTCVGYAVPILADERCLGCLYIDGPAHSHALDSSDIIFLEALTGQLGLALDRSTLASRWREETEREHRRLREEVQDLRQVVQSAHLVYGSTQMQAVLDTLRAVAPTDVTVLINGESGTGKEMLARALHEMSARNDKPLVTVDCGAISHNLLEAELFGYVKGAFTGAQGSSPGRIAQAEGGTLFLDEIGEIPLDVQAKLLRFVQEKEIHPVGAASSRQVDTRIVAATNRNLAQEVAAGRFREDLYYRLKVVTATSPALRDRPDDILLLARHFLDKFALQYQKRVHGFSPEAEQYLHQHGWPGNVRELQNCILRAVVLSDQATLQPDMLHVESSPHTAVVDACTGQPAPQNPAVIAAPESELQPESAGDPWQTLQLHLARQLDVALADHELAPVPLGRWLVEDLVLVADELTRGNARRASSELRVAESTYRRQLKTARQVAAQGLVSRTSTWTGMRSVITRLLTSVPEQACAEGSVIERAKWLLLSEVQARVAGNTAQGSALMGVTVPTYRRWTDSSAC